MVADEHNCDTNEGSNLVTHFHHRNLPSHSTLLSGHSPPDEIGVQSDRLQIWYNNTSEKWSDPQPHAHTGSDECFIVLRGKIIVDVEGERTTIGPGEFCFFPSGLVHSVVAVEPPVESLMIRAPSVADKVYERKGLLPAHEPATTPADLDTLYSIVDGLNQRFPDGDSPFRIIARLCEEAGELAKTVNHFEGTGIKTEKHGDPDRTQLAKEIQDVMRAALSAARHYGVEDELRQSINKSYDGLRNEGIIS